MGLLNKMESLGVKCDDSIAFSPSDSPNISEKPNSIGLLKKIIFLNEKQTLDFFDFVHKYQLTLCSIFELENNFFKITNCFGFDSESILQSISTKDFWYGILPEQNTIYNFSKTDNSLNPFFQFFSENLLDKISQIIIFRNDDKILLFSANNLEIFNDESTIFSDFLKLNIFHLDLLYSPFEKVNQNNCITYSIKFEKAILDFINNKKIDESLIHNFKKVIFNNIFYFLNNSFDNKIIETNDFVIKIYLNKDESVPKELILQHLKISFEEILLSSSKYIEIDSQVEN